MVTVTRPRMRARVIEMSDSSVRNRPARFALARGNVARGVRRAGMESLESARGEIKGERAIVWRDSSRALLRPAEERPSETDDRSEGERREKFPRGEARASARSAVSPCTAAVHCDRTVGQIAKNNRALRERTR